MHPKDNRFIFRAYNVEEKKMTIGVSVTTINSSLIDSKGRLYVGLDDPKYIVTQGASFSDSKNSVIFEGDVVRVGTKDGIAISIVRLSDKWGGGFVLDPIYFGPSENLLMSANEQLEIPLGHYGISSKDTVIIGNIFEEKYGHKYFRYLNKL